MKRSSGYLKFTIIYILGGIFLIGIVLFSFVDIPKPRSRRSPNTHTILQTTNLELAWQRNDVFIDRGEVNTVDLLAQNNHLYFIGNIEPYYPNFGFILDANTGKVISKTEQVEGSFSFTVDGNAFYIGTTHGSELYKYDFQKRQRVWSQTMGFDNNPCCFIVNNGNLLTNWHSGFYRISTIDGSRLEERVRQGTIFFIENGIYYLTGGGNLIGSDQMGNKVWDAKIYAKIQYPPIFRKGRVFIRTEHQLGELYVLNQTTAELLWKGNWTIISNLAISNQRVYFLTTDGYLLGVNIVSGQIEAMVQFSPDNFYQFERDQNYNYQVAYDDVSGLIFVLLGDSAQLLAFSEKK